MLAFWSVRPQGSTPYTPSEPPWVTTETDEGDDSDEGDESSYDDDEEDTMEAVSIEIDTGLPGAASSPPTHHHDFHLDHHEPCRVQVPRVHVLETLEGVTARHAPGYNMQSEIERWFCGF